jgi:hypothetical protein
MSENASETLAAELLAERRQKQAEEQWERGQARRIAERDAHRALKAERRTVTRSDNNGREYEREEKLIDPRPPTTGVGAGDADLEAAKQALSSGEGYQVLRAEPEDELQQKAQKLVRAYG